MLPNQRLNFGGNFEYQIAPFFSGFVGLSWMKQNQGWQQPFVKKTALPSEQVTQLILGIDLIVSRSIWYKQSILLPVSGTNQVTPFLFVGTFTFNKFGR